MNNDELVARQARLIASMKDKLKEYSEACHEIHNIIYCIGGPLNDNKLGYNGNQKIPFKKIVNLLPDPFENN